MDVSHEVVKLPIGLIDTLSEAKGLDQILEAVAEWLPSIVEAHRSSVAIYNGETLAIRGFYGGRIFDLDTPALQRRRTSPSASA